VGDVRGILEITQPLDTITQKTRGALQNLFLLLAGLSILGITGLTLAITRLRQNAKHHAAINIRIGINTGPAIAGVIGTKKFIYDLCAMPSIQQRVWNPTGLLARFKSQNQLTISCKISICLKTEELSTSKARAI